MSVLIAVLAYLGGLLIGLLFTIAVPALNNRANLFQMAEDQARSILDTYSPDSGPTFGTEFYLLAEDGTTVYANTEFLHPDERERARKTRGTCCVSSAALRRRRGQAGSSRASCCGI